MGLTSTLSLVICNSKWQKLARKISPAMVRGRAVSHFFAVLRVEQDPTKLNDFGRVLGHVDTMLITGGGYMDNYVAVDVATLGLRGRHIDGRRGGRGK